MVAMNANASRRGLLIAVEGGDRCGKTTQCQMIANWLKSMDRQVVCQKFPDRSTQIGRVINEYLSNGIELNDHSIHLLFSANRWELRDTILELISKDVIVLCDRYVPSGIAYSAAKGLDLKWCATPDKHLPKPDLVIFLDSSAQVAAQRENYGTERYEKVEFQAKVRSVFLDNLRDDTWKIIDASKSADKVFEGVKAAIEETLCQQQQQVNAIEEYNFKW